MKASKEIASRSDQSFSLGLDTITLSHLKKLQDSPKLILRGNKIPSRTLVTRQALRFYSSVMSQAVELNKTEWLLMQNNELQKLAKQGKKSSS
jgi:hypothetical protein